MTSYCSGLIVPLLKITPVVRGQRFCNSTGYNLLAIRFITVKIHSDVRSSNSKTIDMPRGSNTSPISNLGILLDSYSY